VKTYTIYDEHKIKCIISGTEETLALNIAPGDMHVEGYFSDEFYYVKNSEIQPLPAKPAYPCYFDNTIDDWVWNEQASWAILRQERDMRLSACDWTQVPDAPVDQAAWAAYRQALRDLPANTIDPREPAWPAPPL
jgi:hypothetical protein